MLKGERVVQDFNIQKEAGGSKRALIKTFEATVTNTIIEVHFFWAGKGTCCIPFQSTYGPLVSAVHVYQGSLYLFLLFLTYNCIFHKSIILSCYLFVPKLNLFLRVLFFRSSSNSNTFSICIYRTTLALIVQRCSHWKLDH